MDWKTWLWRTDMEQSAVDKYSSIFTRNQLDETDMIFFDHKFLVKIGILLAKDRIEIIKQVKKEKYSRAINTAKKFIRSIGYKVCLCVSRKHASSVANAVLPNRSYAVNSTPETNGDNGFRAANDDSIIWGSTEINERSQCQFRRLRHQLRATKILGLLYLSDNEILALVSNGVNLKWKWRRSHRNPNGKVTSSLPPPFCAQSKNLATLDSNPKDSVPLSAIVKWFPFPRFVNAIASIALRIRQLCCWILMKKGSESDETGNQNPNDSDVLHCFTLSKNKAYTLSACGGQIYLFHFSDLKLKGIFMPPPPLITTSIALYPENNNIIAIGMNNSSIRIYNFLVNEVITNLYGHSKQVTGLAFSNVLRILVSCSADDQICIWGYDEWEKKNTKSLTIPDGRTTTGKSNTRVKFDDKQKQFLVVHETHLAVYEATNLECVKQWVPTESSISDATYSSGSHLIFACFLNATVFILDALHLTPRCRINPSAYLPSQVRSIVNPLAIAAHPNEKNQFVLGFSDGRIILFEPNQYYASSDDS